MELKIEEYLKEIKEEIRKGTTIHDIYDICKSCPNSPEDWQD
jgi:hypothetical protein